MSYAETILPEFDQEMANTRKVLERIPDDKLDWKAHPKSHTIGWNANHVADIPNWLADGAVPALAGYRAGGREPYPFPKLTTTREILELFDKNVAAARKAITEAGDEEMASPWTLSQAGQTVLHHAAVGGGPEHGPQPPDAPPRPPHRLPPPERHPGPRHVRAVGRRIRGSPGWGIRDSRP